MNRLTRKVGLDATISIDKIYYDVPMQFIRTTVHVRFLPLHMDGANLSIQIFFTCLIYAFPLLVFLIFRQLCSAIGIEANSKKTIMFENIQQQLYHLHKEKRKTFILAIDESQYLNAGILRDLKMLMNADYDSLDCFSLILVGQPHLTHILEKPIHEALKQRILIHYNYEGLSSDESADYIYSRIEAAGGARSIIDEAAVHSVSSFCQGTPRIINSVMTNALILGAQLKHISISTDLILSASADLSLI